MIHPVPIQISFSKGEQYAQQVNAIFVETSALEATNVEEVFVHISELKSLNWYLFMSRSLWVKFWYDCQFVHYGYIPIFESLAVV